MTSGVNLDRQDDNARAANTGDRVRSACVVLAGATIMVGLAVAAMSMLTSPDGWLMKAANQAMMDQQQAVATSFLLADN